MLCVVIMDAAPDDHKAVGIGRIEEVDGAFLTFTGPVGIHVAVLHAHVAAAVDRHGAVAALIDFRSSYAEIGTILCPDADDTAAVQTAGIDGDRGTAVKIKNTACAETGFLCMPGGQTGHFNVPASAEGDDICITRICADYGFPDARTAQSKISDIPDLEFPSVIGFIPQIIRVPGFTAVISCFREAVGSFFQLNHGVRRNRGKQFIHGTDTDNWPPVIF